MASGVVLGGRLFLLIAVVVFAAWRAWCWRRHGIRWANEAVVLMLFAWSAAVAYLAFFPMNIIFYDWHGRFSLVPLSSTIDMIRYSTVQTLVKNIGGNVLLFVPLGFLLPILFKRLRGVWSMLWRAAVLSAAIEVMQIPTQVRSTDVDDVIFNVIGALFGLAVFWVASALAGKAHLRPRIDGLLSSRARREPLLIALVPVAITLLLTTAVLAPKVIDQTLSRAAVTRAALADLAASAEAARSEVGGFLFVVTLGNENGQELLRLSEFKAVLPGRFTQTAWSDVVRAGGSGYAASLTAFNVTRKEKPVLYMWGRNDAGATSVTVTIAGRPAEQAAIGRYFVVALPYDASADLAGDGLLSEFSFTFNDSAGSDVTAQFARW